MGEIRNIYSMVYDSRSWGTNGYGKFLGKFKVIQQITEDGWEDTFVGQNIETEELCLILSHEVCGFGGGISYQVCPLHNVILNESVVL